MKKRNNGDIFTATSTLKILSFLVENPGREFLGSEIQKAVSISRAGVYIALRELTRQKLVTKIKKGKFLMYSVLYEEPILKQFKVMRNTQYLKPLIEKLKNHSKKIVLYGSASRGEDDPKSDIDLFILTSNPDAVKDIIAKAIGQKGHGLANLIAKAIGQKGHGLANLIAKAKAKRKMQAIIKTPSELAQFQEKEKVYSEEVNRGITLWEKKE